MCYDASALAYMHIKRKIGYDKKTIGLKNLDVRYEEKFHI